MGYRVLIVEDGGFDSGLGRNLAPTDLNRALLNHRAGHVSTDSDINQALALYTSFPQRLTDRLHELGKEVDGIHVERSWTSRKHPIQEYGAIVCDLGVPTPYSPHAAIVGKYLDRQHASLQALLDYFRPNERCIGMVEHLELLLSPQWRDNMPKLKTFWSAQAGFFAVVEDIREYHRAQGNRDTVSNYLLFTSDYRHAAFTLPLAVLFEFLTADEVIRTHEQRTLLRERGEADFRTTHFSLSRRFAVGPKTPRSDQQVSDADAFESWVRVVSTAIEKQLGV